MIKELQNRIRGYLYQYGLGYTAEALGISKYYINKAINETSPDFDLLEKLKRHFDKKEAEKQERLEKLLK